MRAYRNYDVNAIQELVAAGPERLSSVEHTGFTKHESEIIRLVESRDAYMIAPDRLDQNYLDEDLVRGIYSSTASIFESVADKHFPPVPRALAQSWLSVSPADRVLEIAVATGANLTAYPRCTEVIGIDISEESIKLAKTKASSLGPGFRVELMNAEKTNFGDRYFDKVLVLCGLCVARNPFRILQEVRRVLKPNGAFVLYEPSLSGIKEVDLLLYLLQPIGRDLGAVWFDDFPARTIPYNTFWDLPEMLKATEFEIEETVFFDAPYNTLRMSKCRA